MKAAQADEFELRRGRVAADLAARKLDALIVSSLANIRYLSGFTGSNAMLLLAAGGAATLFTDPRYGIQAERETACKVRVVRRRLDEFLMKAAGRRRYRRLGFEKGRITFETYERLKERLYLGATLEGVSGVVEARRMVKSDAEIVSIRRSVELNSEAFDRAMKKVRPGLSEAELAAEIEYQMRLLGAEGPAFETIVASGERTALPHARPTANTLNRNQLLLVDVGATLAGYTSDMTRMAFLGKPGRSVRRIYDAVLEAQLAAIDAVRPGVSAGQVDAAARRVLRAGKLDKAFVHSTGHGLGLEIHEAPRLGNREKTRLETGMVITIEPGAYLEGVGGVRIEDTVAVTANGCAILTPTSKELTLL